MRSRSNSCRTTANPRHHAAKGHGRSSKPSRDFEIEILANTNSSRSRYLQQQALSNLWDSWRDGTSSPVRHARGCEYARRDIVPSALEIRTRWIDIATCSWNEKDMIGNGTMSADPRFRRERSMRGAFGFEMGGRHRPHRTALRRRLAGDILASVNSPTTLAGADRLRSDGIQGRRQSMARVNAISCKYPRPAAPWQIRGNSACGDAPSWNLKVVPKLSERVTRGRTKTSSHLRSFFARCSLRRTLRALRGVQASELLHAIAQIPTMRYASGMRRQRGSPDLSARVKVRFPSSSFATAIQRGSGSWADQV